MASKTSIGPEIRLRWNLLSPSGPAGCHHVGCLIGNIMYVHGGIEQKNSTAPSNKLHKLDLKVGIWNEVRATGSPALSHHACVVIDSRYIMMIGGWNGSRRSSDVYLYDCNSDHWSPGATAGFPTGGGLSSHTATLLQNGDILVIGREGSLRTQRRTGQAYLLRGSVTTNRWEYSLIPMDIDSRSGHTSHILGQTLTIFGGREDKPLELHNGFKGNYKNAILSCGVISQLHSLCKNVPPLPKPPGGRKNHVGGRGEQAVLYHGGETFDGRIKEPVGRIYLLQIKPNVEWFDLGESGLGRAGHVMCTTEHTLVIHGGFSGRGTVHGDSYQLEVLHTSGKH